MQPSLTRPTAHSISPFNHEPHSSPVSHLRHRHPTSRHLASHAGTLGLSRILWHSWPYRVRYKSLVFIAIVRSPPRSRRLKKCSTRQGDRRAGVSSPPLAIRHKAAPCITPPGNGLPCCTEWRGGGENPPVFMTLHPAGTAWHRVLTINHNSEP